MPSTKALGTTAKLGYMYGVYWVTSKKFTQNVYYQGDISEISPYLKAHISLVLLRCKINAWSVINAADVTKTQLVMAG